MRSRPSSLILFCAVLLVAVLGPPVRAQAQPAQMSPATGDTSELKSLSPEELFLRASSSALQFQHLREPSRRLLVRDYGTSLPYLVTKLASEDARERHALEDILKKIGEPAVRPLIDAFESELRRDDTSRGARMAAGILGKLGDDSAVPSLESGASHDEWKVRSSVASALGRIADPGASDALLELLSDENEIVRKSAAAALARIAEDDANALDETAMARLARALGDSYYAVRYGASRAIGACGERALPLLESLAREGGEHSRLLATRALGIIGTGKARHILRSLTESDDWTLRAHAARALAGAGPSRRDRHRLRELAGDPHPLVSSIAEDALEVD